MNSKLWAIVILIVSATILLDMFGVIAIGSIFEIVLVIGLIILLVIYVRSRKASNG